MYDLLWRNWHHELDASDSATSPWIIKTGQVAHDMIAATPLVEPLLEITGLGYLLPSRPKITYD